MRLSYTEQLLKMDASGAIIAVVENVWLSRSNVADDGSVWAAEYSTWTPIRLSSTGQVLVRLPQYRVRNGAWATDPATGNTWGTVLDVNNQPQRVLVAPDGTVLVSVPPSTDCGDWDIDLAPDSGAYMWDCNGVVRLDAQGNELWHFGSWGWMYGLASDSEGNVWVAQYCGHTVQKLSPIGQVLATYSNVNAYICTGLPGAIAVDRSDDGVWLANVMGELIRLDRDGQELFRLPFPRPVSLSAVRAAPPIRVSIDIKPGSDPNSINLRSKGVVPVAILSTPTFDATQIDPASVTLAGARVRLTGKGDTYSCATEDVNGDDTLDLVCHVVTAQFTIEPGDSIAILEGQTVGGRAIRGEDSIRVVR